MVMRPCVSGNRREIKSRMGGTLTRVRANTSCTYCARLCHFVLLICFYWLRCPLQVQNYIHVPQKPTHILSMRSVPVNYSSHWTPCLSELQYLILVLSLILLPQCFSLQGQGMWVIILYLSALSALLRKLRVFSYLLSWILLWCQMLLHFSIN